MYVVADLHSDKLKSIYRNSKTVDLRKNCYVVKVSDDFEAIKFVKKGYWKQLKDKKGNLLWDKSENLKPLMGFEICKNDSEIDIFNNLDFWTIKEVLEIKYIKKLEKLEKYSHVFYDEFIDDEQDKGTQIKGNLNIGKRICYGKGTIIHNFKLNNNKICFDCEYQNQLPNIEISLDGKTFIKIEKLPYIHDFRKTAFKKVYLRIDDHKNFLTAYSFYFNGKESNSSLDYTGRKILNPTF